MRIFDRFPSLFSSGFLQQLTRAKNWRLVVFATVFLIVTVGGLFYVYSRPVEFRAGARLEITPAEKPTNDANAPAAETSEDAAFLTEVQLFTARESLEEVAARIRRIGFGALLSGPDPVLSLQDMITVEPVQGTHVVQVWAIGEKPEILPFVLNELISVYEARVGERFVGTSRAAVNQASEEVTEYKTAILHKRAELEAFRIQHGIVTSELEESEITARAKALNGAVNAAKENALIAQTRLRALRAAMAEGKPRVRAKDYPTLAALEQRLSQAREELKQLERRYTAAYLAREPQVAALKTKIPELEDQIRREREASQRAYLADAEQEAAQTQNALNRLRKQLSSNKQATQAFFARLGEYKALQAQLENIEKLQQGAAERLVKLQARENARKPRVQIIQSAYVANEPWRPHYTRDAGVVIASALVLAWLAAWLADFLLRREPGPTIIVASTPITYPIDVTELTPMPQPALGTPPSVGRLPSPRHVLRELDDAELAALLDSADDESRVALIALLSGVSPEELVELTWDNIDLETDTLRITRPTPRAILLGPEIAALFAALKQKKRAKADERVLGGKSGEPVRLSHLEEVISYAAHDAGLAQPADITPTVIRHTFIVFLVRQGIRFSELPRVVGPLPAGVTVAYGAIVPTATRRPLEETDRVIPALRGFANSLESKSRKA
jgi:succinoglycan biosynthesis transport protein ExoP